MSRSRILPLLLVPVVASLSTGCVSSRYKPASKRTPPAPVLDLAAGSAAGAVVVHSVIIYRGPGSWKRNAFWDEYVVTVRNPANVPLELVAVELIDFADQPVHPGLDPWPLEKASQTDQARLGRALGTSFKIGAGAAVAVAPSVGLATASLLTGATSAGATALTGALLPAYLVGTVYRNVSNRRDIEAQFDRRRLLLPRTLAPGEHASGSLFFPVTPGPRRLVLVCRQAGSEQRLVVDLQSLSGLHRRPPAGTRP